MLLTGQQKNDRDEARRVTNILQDYVIDVTIKNLFDSIVDPNIVIKTGLKLPFGHGFDVSNVPNAPIEFVGLSIVLNLAPPDTLVKSVYLRNSGTIIINFFEPHKLRGGRDRHEFDDFYANQFVPIMASHKLRREQDDLDGKPWLDFLRSRFDQVFRCVKSSFRREYVSHLEFIRCQ